MFFFSYLVFIFSVYISEIVPACQRFGHGAKRQHLSRQFFSVSAYFCSMQYLRTNRWSAIYQVHFFFIFSKFKKQVFYICYDLRLSSSTNVFSVSRVLDYYLSTPVLFNQPCIILHISDY